MKNKQIIQLNKKRHFYIPITPKKFEVLDTLGFDFTFRDFNKIYPNPLWKEIFTKKILSLNNMEITKVFLALSDVIMNKVEKKLGNSLKEYDFIKISIPLFMKSVHRKNEYILYVSLKILKEVE